MEADRTIEELVTSSRQGNLDAFGELVRRFQDMAVGYAYAILGDHNMAEDVAQESFIQVYLNLASLQEPSAFPGWFKKVVFSCSHRTIRRKRLPMVDLEELQNFPDDSPEPAREVERKLVRAEILSAVKSLPEEQRAILILYYINEFSYRHIAAFLNISETTVTNRLAAAKKKMRKELMGILEDSVRGLSVATNGNFVRKVLEEVPRVGFYQGGNIAPEDIPISSVMRACLRFLGEPYGFTTIHLHEQDWQVDNAAILYTAVTGAAFRFIWRYLERPTGGIDPAYMTVYGDRSIARAMQAAGYSYRLLLKPEYANQIGCTAKRIPSQTALRELIIASIHDRTSPVIGLGVVGGSEPCIINGYDQGGEVLMGWAYTIPALERSDGLDFTPSGYFRKREWYRDTLGVVLMGEKKPRPPLREVYRRALEWGLELLRLEEVDGMPAGWASYAEWAETFLNPAKFPPPQIPGMAGVYGYLNPVIWELAERRWYGAMFMEYMLHQDSGIPEEPLCAARDCFNHEHDLMWKISNFVMGGGDLVNLDMLRDDEVRRTIAGIILEARESDIQAAGHIERLLKATW
jgi:RNA polymerase sigma factor (sigma-70 family)